MPVSLTAKCSVAASPLDALDADPDDDLALLGELDGVADEVQQHLTQPPGIAEHHVGHVGRDVAGELEPFSAGAQRQQLGRVAHGLAQVELDALQIEPPGLDLREVEDVVDDGEQRPRRRTCTVSR